MDFLLILGFGTMAFLLFWLRGKLFEKAMKSGMAGGKDTARTLRGLSQALLLLGIVCLIITGGFILMLLE